MGYLNNQLEKKANIKNLYDILAIAASGGAGTLLSDKDSAMDKLKTGLATGAGASAGVFLPMAYDSIVDKIMESGKKKAETVWNKLSEKTDHNGEEWLRSLGKDRAKYEYYAPKINMTVEDMMEMTRKAAIRRNAADKAKLILDKVNAKRSKFDKVLLPLTLAATPLGGYLGYKYMED